MAIAVSSWARADGGPPSGDLCGTSERTSLRSLALHQMWAAEPATVLPTTQSFDRGDIAVLEDDGTLLRPSGAYQVLDVIAASRAFYKTHGDDYDFLCLYNASSIPTVVIPGSSAFAFENNVVQDVQGIGLPVADQSLDYGSSGRLRSLLNLNSLGNYPADPFQDFNVTNNTMDILAHETAHRWAAYVAVDSAGISGTSLLGAGLAHWNFYFNDQASMVGGNEWTDNGDGSWTTTGATARYGQLELYLMGFLPADSVGALPVLENPNNCSPPANYTRQHHPQIGVTCFAQPYSFSMADVIAANGPRVPSAAASPRIHRFAFVLVIPNGTTPTQADLDKIETIRGLWPAYFSMCTGGRATAQTFLTHHAGSVVISHKPLPDTESSAHPYTVSAGVSIHAGSLPMMVDASSVRLHYAAGGGPLTPIVMAEGPPGTFHADIPAQPSGTLVRYAIFAASDSTGINAWSPAGAPAVTDTFHVGPDAIPPKVAFLWRPPVLKRGVVPYRFRALATDNLGVARVFGTASMNGGPRDTVEFTRSGASDTFYVDLAPGAGVGDHLSLDVHAVDASAARHGADAPECPGGCSFSWGNDWFEPLDVDDGGFVTYSASAFRTNSWVWSAFADATGAKAWRCGDDGPLYYPRDLDADLETPPLFLTGDAELHVRHRYEFEEESPGVGFDGGRVEMSVRGGPYAPLDPAGGYPDVLATNDTPLAAGTPVYSGRSPGWAQGQFADAVFTVASAETATVRFRFRAVSDGFVGKDGWVVDDLRLAMLPPSAGVPGGPGGPTAFLAPSPNPARGHARFSARLARPSWLSLEIYDARGRKLDQAYEGRAAAGDWSFEWKPASISPGLYFARLSVREGEEAENTFVRRFVLLP